MEKHKLDPAHFMTAPSVSWSASLKLTKVKLELMTDPDMSMFIDRSLIGGFSGVTHPYAKANNLECPDYDPKLPLSWILVMDANNLYGFAMRQYLPTGGFKWVPVEERENWAEFILQQQDEQEEGYFLEVDLDYPEELHNLHDNYPCAPEKMKIEERYLSDHQKQLGKKCGANYKIEKLCLTLNSKKKYILHYRNLKQYLSLGLKLSKVHRVLKFKQSSWLKKYIDMNTQFRQEANNKFEVSLYKLMNNSFFGKTCEDVRKYRNVKIVIDEKQIDKLSKKENFGRWHIYDENLASVLMEKTSVKLNKPRYIGSAILALSKTVMYDFHYSYMMKKFPDCKLLFTDTDSFCYKIPDVEDVYATIKDSDWFDFSNFPKDHPNYKENNKMIPGKFKDECPNNTILEFVGLRSKMYSILPKEGEKKATAKGVNQRITRNEIKQGDYRNCLMNNEQMYHKMVNIAHDHHQLETSSTLKKSLSPFNDKKWIDKNETEFTTYSFGHKDIAGEPKYNYNKIIIHINLRCGGSRCSIECFGNR